MIKVSFNNHCLSGYTGSRLLITQCSSSTAALALAFEEMYTTTIMTAVNSLGIQSALHFTIIYLKSGEQCFSIVSVVVHQSLFMNICILLCLCSYESHNLCHNHNTAA